MSDESRIILMAFKSTLDRIVGDLAIELSAAAPAASPVKSFDLDDAEGMRQVQAGTEHALVYQFITLAPDPRHPLYSCEFLVGAKTTNDAGNYAITDLLTDVAGMFTPNAFFDLKDWSGDTEPTEILGTLMVTDAVPSAQMFENQAGIRLYQVSGKVMA